MSHILDDNFYLDYGLTTLSEQKSKEGGYWLESPS